MMVAMVAVMMMMMMMTHDHDHDHDDNDDDDDDDETMYIYIYTYSYIHILFCVQALFSTTMNHTMHMALLNMMPWTWPTEVSCIPGTGAGNRGRLADYCRITDSE